MGRKKPTQENQYGRIVRKAAEILEDREWCQGSYGTMTTKSIAIEQTLDEIANPVCAHTAILMASTPLRITQHGVLGNINKMQLGENASLHLADWLKANGQTRNDIIEGTPSVPGWNDTKGRTKEEVLLWMRKYADEMDPQSP